MSDEFGRLQSETSSSRRVILFPTILPPPTRPTIVPSNASEKPAFENSDIHSYARRPPRIDN